MSSDVPKSALQGGTSVSFEIASDLVRSDALLKTCYWHSRDYACDVMNQSSAIKVVLTAKHDLLANASEVARDFMAQAMDFELRERVNISTAEVRDLLLAKAFAESGILEDTPSGVFGDMIEESKPAGLFKILQNS